MITKITIEVAKKRWDITISFEGTHTDRMGEWISSGQLGVVYKVDCRYVQINPLNQKPVAVYDSVTDMVKRLKEKHNCPVELKSYC